MRSLIMLPIVILGLTGCVVAGPGPGPAYVEQGTPMVVEQPAPVVVARPVVVVRP